MSRWFELNEADHALIKFAVIIAKYNDQFIIIFNKKRNGWEIPGGNREEGESILYTASRELYEETGAVKFELTPFGIYEWKESLGMAFYAEVIKLSSLPNFEIEEIKLIDELPEQMNFGDMFYTLLSKWRVLKEMHLRTYSIDINELEQVKELAIS
ncbi:NUDIX hydrolase [Paenibacillus dakarensis]|uniref:NUDIX hydrolase n=1 Tax=Paenibacillus dakarensis TaxID=1527293 RepID=UPI0006D52ED8|nr:NUDIX domain-containing protein [Paenibacillus dakarensis]